MRSLILLTGLICLYSTSHAQKLASGPAYTVIEAIPEGYKMSLSFGDISLQAAENNWYKINVNDAAHLLQQCAPEMPYKAYSFLVADETMTVTIKNSTYTDYQNYDIVPSKGNLVRTQDPSTIPAVAGPVYQQNAFFPAQVATVANDYMIRHAHGTAIHIFPVQYNPVTHTLRVYSHMELEVKAGTVLKPRETSTNATWDNIYKRHFVNYHLAKTSQAKTTSSIPSEEGDMLIITPAAYLPTIQPFIQWKKERGIRCYLLNLDTLTSGPDPDSIHAYIGTYYQQLNINYVILVGDESEMPPVESIDLAGPSDAAYTYQSGNDHYPDLMIGRFSANSIQELQPQIIKSIEYEKNPGPAQNWYTRSLGIASNEGPGDDNQMDWEHMAAIRNQLLGASFSYVYEAYDGTHNGTIAPLDAPGNPDEMDIITAINSGISLINYCGHGSATSLGTSGFSNYEVPYLTNANGDWPFFLTVACITGKFMNGNTSLAEEMMRATDGNQPTGMVAGFMSSIDQYWDPPMEAQDEFNNIITGNGSNHLYSIGALALAGCLSMNDAYPGSGYDMTDTWVMFGDPSLQLRYAHPDDLTAIHPQTILYTATDLGVELNKQYGDVVLLHHDTLYSVQSATSFTTTHNITPLPVGDSLRVVATAPNTRPYFGWVRIVDPTSLKEINTAGAFSIYPNPAGNSVMVTGITGPTAYICTDVTGRLMIEGMIDEQHTTINTSQLVPGTYFVQLNGPFGTRTLPLQVLR